MPHASIGVDVIAGFSGETDEDFLETYDFIKNLNISYLHVFTFSERSGTEAAAMAESIPVNIRRERNTRLSNLSLKKKHAFYSRFINQTRRVLVEKSKEKDLYTGFTDNYIKVKFHSSRNLENNQVDIRLLDIDADYIMQGKVDQ